MGKRNPIFYDLCFFFPREKHEEAAERVAELSMSQARASQTSVPCHVLLEPPIGQGLICSQETKCITLLYDASRFQKCIGEP